MIINIDKCELANTDRITYSNDKNGEKIYTSSYMIYRCFPFTRKGNSRSSFRLDITLNASGKHKNQLLNIIENRVRDEMKKNPNITIKELVKITGFGFYPIRTFYMKIRREGDIFEQ